MTQKRTPFYNAHLRAGGRMIDFGGWQMPIQYTSVLEEHHTVRKAVGLFDVSHMGEIDVTGPDTNDFAQYLITNNINSCKVGQAQYTVMCYPEGGIVDDLISYRLADQHILFVVNAANVDKDFDWMKECAEDFDVEVTNRSADYAQLALQGPLAEEVLENLTAYPLNEIAPFRFVSEDVAGARAIIARTGYTGEPGFELYFDPAHAEIVWTALLTAGRPYGLRPIGLGARDTLRLEMKYALYGNDIDETTNPLEAGLGWVVKWKKGEFIGRKALLQEKRSGVRRKLVGFELKERGVPRPGYPVMIPPGERIGTVASGGMSPSLSRPIGTAYLPKSLSAVGSEFLIEIRKKTIPAVVVDTPFYKHSNE